MCRARSLSQAETPGRFSLQFGAGSATLPPTRDTIVPIMRRSIPSALCPQAMTPSFLPPPPISNLSEDRVQNTARTDCRGHQQRQSWIMGQTPERQRWHAQQRVLNRFAPALFLAWLNLRKVRFARYPGPRRHPHRPRREQARPAGDGCPANLRPEVQPVRASPGRIRARSDPETSASPQR